jgi:hypothetical protein
MAVANSVTVPMDGAVLLPALIRQRPYRHLVKTHVATELAKRGTRDRTQAVIAAYEAAFMNAR